MSIETYIRYLEEKALIFLHESKEKFTATGLQILHFLKTADYPSTIQPGILVQKSPVQSQCTFNPLGANPTNWSNTTKQFVGNLPTNCLSVFDHFVGLALKGLKNVH